MGADLQRGIGDMLRVQHWLKPGDAATQERMQQLLGLAPDAALLSTAASTEVTPPSSNRRWTDDVEVEPTESEQSPADSRLRQDVSLGWRKWAVAALMVVELLVLVFGGAIAAAIVGAVVLITTVVLVLWLRRQRNASIDPVPARLSSRDRRTRWEHRAEALGGREPEPAPPPAVPSLLPPHWASGIIAAMLATASPSGPVDEERLVELLSRREIPQRLPRRWRRSLSAGANVLVDTSEAMLPFRADSEELVACIRRVVGDDRLSIDRFAGNPLAGAGPGRRTTWKQYEPPSTSRPVLVVTNLGLSGRPLVGAAESEAQWLALARMLRRVQCTLIALVPFSPERVPESLRAEIAVLEWDRTMTVSTALRVVARRSE